MEYRTLRKLDYDYSQLCMVAPGARRRSLVTPISWQSLWNTCFLRCNGPARSCEPVAGRHSYGSELFAAICNRHRVVLSST